TAAPLTISGSLILQNFAVVVGGHVAILADEHPTVPGSPRPYAIYSAPIDASSAPLRLGELVDDTSAVLHASSERVLYRTRTTAPSVELMSVPMDGSSAPVRLHGELLAER